MQSESISEKGKGVERHVCLESELSVRIIDHNTVRLGDHEGGATSTKGR